jgi:hypothetical protein
VEKEKNVPTAIPERKAEGRHPVERHAMRADDAVALLLL